MDWILQSYESESNKFWLAHLFPWSPFINASASNVPALLDLENVKNTRIYLENKLTTPDTSITWQVLRHNG